MIKPIDWWYCCLNVRERTIVRQTCEGLVLTLFSGVPVPIWDVLWLGTGYTDARYKEAFRTIYGLEIATIDGDGGPIEVVRPIDGMLPSWVLWSLYVVTPSAACLEGCGQSTVP